MGFVFAGDVQSAVADSECARLAQLAEGRTALVVGAYLGRSTIAVASTARRVHSVDWHRGDAHAGEGDTWDPFVKNVLRYGMRDRVVVHMGRFEDVLPALAPATFDLAFIDGFHERAAVERDLALTLPLMKPDGVLAFHDYGIPHFGVTQVVDAFAAARGAPVEVVRTLAVVGPARPA